MNAPESEARKALNRVRRAVEKARREMDSLEGALRHVEAEDFPASSYREAGEHIQRVLAFLDDEAQRLEEKMLQAGGLEPGRVRRSSVME